MLWNAGDPRQEEAHTAASLWPSPRTASRRASPRASPPRSQGGGHSRAPSLASLTPVCTPILAPTALSTAASSPSKFATVPSTAGDRGWGGGGGGGSPLVHASSWDMRWSPAAHPTGSTTLEKKGARQPKRGKSLSPIFRVCHTPIFSLHITVFFASISQPGLDPRAFVLPPSFSSTAAPPSPPCHAKCNGSALGGSGGRGLEGRGLEGGEGFLLMRSPSSSSVSTGSKSSAVNSR